MWDRCRTHDSATRSLSGVIICPVKGTAVVRRTPSPWVIIRFAPGKSTLSWQDSHSWLSCQASRPTTLRGDSVGKNGAIPGRDEIPSLVRRAVAWGQCGGKPEKRKNDCGTGRSDTRERETGDKSRRAGPCRVRSKCAASPCCRTIGNARSKHIRWESPRRKSARHKLGTATGAACSIPLSSPSRYACGNGGDCRFDRPDTTRFSSPLRGLQGYVKAYAHGKFHLCMGEPMHIVSPWRG
jgi:hypothetical protein